MGAWPRISTPVGQPFSGGVALEEMAVMVTPGTAVTFALYLIEEGSALGPCLVGAVVNGNADGHDVVRVIAERVCGRRRKFRMAAPALASISRVRAICPAMSTVFVARPRMLPGTVRDADCMTW